MRAWHRLATGLAEARSGPLAVLAVAWVALVSLLFLLFPGLDLAATALFHEPGAGFPAQTSPLLMRLRELGPFLVKLIAGVSLLLVLAAALLPHAGRRIPLRPPLFLLAGLVLGPGVLVNAVLKDNWGRPRPVTVEAFGGDDPYVPVWYVSDHCATNCSFVSGEGSASFWLLSLALLAPARWRLGVVVGLMPICLALSANRVAFGGHFLSDTLLAWGLTLLVVLAVRVLLWEIPGAEARARRWRDRFDRGAAAFRMATVRAAGEAGAAARRFLARFA